MTLSVAVASFVALMRVFVRASRSLFLCGIVFCSSFLVSLAQACAGAPFEVQHLCKVINDDNWYLSADYSSAIDQWPDSLLIWQYLESDFARYRFARYVMNLEKPKEYIKGRKIPNAIDLTFCYECRHFSRERYYKYSLAQQRLNVDSEYTFEKAIRKYQIPIHEVEQSSLNMKNGHMINAVYLGNESANPRDIMNWMFFEPQDNRILHSAERPLHLSNQPVFKPGTVLHIFPELHSAKMDRFNHDPRLPQGSAVEDLKSYIFAVDKSGVMKNLKIPNLDAFASVVPMGAATEIVRHRYIELRHVFIRQASEEARESIINSIRLWGDWPEKQIAFLTRLKVFLSRIEKKYVDLNQSHMADGISNVIAYIDEPFMWIGFQTMPWFNELIEFLESEKKFLRLKIPQEFIFQLDAERVLGALEKCAAKLGSNPQ